MVKEIVEEEVDLRDYLRVIQRNKFLILAVTLASLVLAAYLSLFVLQNEYQTGAKIYIKSVPADLFNAELYNPDVVATTITSTEVIAKTVEQSGLAEDKSFKDSNEDPAAWLKNSVKINIKNRIIDINLRGAIDSGTLEKILRTQIDVFKKENNERFIHDAENETERLDAMNATLIKQREDVVLDLAIAGNSSDKVVVLDRFLSLSSRLNTIDEELNKVQMSRKNLEFAVQNLNWIETISAPYKPELVGPKRMLNIAIAGIFGLFIGITIAFFKNYMEEIPPK